MSATGRLPFMGRLAVAVCLALTCRDAGAQQVKPPDASADRDGDTVEIAPGPEYQAGGMHRSRLGNGYRDYWATPLRVPVLDLETLHGGLEPLKEGGGKQSKSLRFTTPDGTEFVFRSVNKNATTYEPAFKGTVVQ